MLSIKLYKVFQLKRGSLGCHSISVKPYLYVQNKLTAVTLLFLFFRPTTWAFSHWTMWT